jgi:hypothetical protein
LACCLAKVLKTSRAHQKESIIMISFHHGLQPARHFIETFRGLDRAYMVENS